jgi:hypothetical protein
MKIGRDVMNFNWGDNRKARWTRLCSKMLGNEEYVSALTALLNLDWCNSTKEKNIPDSALKDGFIDHVWPLLEKMRPRLVCPLTNRVWKTMLPEIEPLRVVNFEPCPVTLPRQPIVFRFVEADFMSFFIKPHNHPSRALSNDQIDDVGRACQWFLGQNPTER